MLITLNALPGCGSAQLWPAATPRQPQSPVITEVFGPEDFHDIHVFLQEYVNVLQRPYSVSAAFHVWTCAYTISSTYPIFTLEIADLKEILWSMCSVDTKLTYLISDTMEVKEWLSRLEDFLCGYININ